MANEPPTMLPTTPHQAIEGTIPTAVTAANNSPPRQAKIPTLSLAAFPAASMLHSSPMLRNLNCSISTDVFVLFSQNPHSIAHSTVFGGEGIDITDF